MAKPTFMIFNVETPSSSQNSEGIINLWMLSLLTLQAPLFLSWHGRQFHNNIYLPQLSGLNILPVHLFPEHFVGVLEKQNSQSVHTAVRIFPIFCSARQGHLPSRYQKWQSSNKNWKLHNFTLKWLKMESTNLDKDTENIPFKSVDCIKELL